MRSTIKSALEKAAPCSVEILISEFEGGTANHVRAVAERLAGSQCRAEILCTDHRAPANQAAVPVKTLSERRRLDRFPFTQLAHLVEVGRAPVTGRADLLHAYFYWPIMYGRILKLLGRVSTLVENREDEGFDWTEREYAMLRATRTVPDRVVCVSRAIAELVKRREGVPPERVTVIHNGIDPPASAERGTVRELRRRLGITDEERVVGMVANYERPVKGMDRLLEAVPLVLAEEPGVRFVIVGRGPDFYERQVVERGLGDRVLFAGHQENVAPFYGLMDVSVLTSLSEGLPLVLLESMGHGLPVVATAVGGNAEVVVEGATGYLVPAGDPSAFTDRVVRLLRDRELRRKMGERGRRRIARHFSLDTVARRYGDMYQELAKPGGRP